MSRRVGVILLSTVSILAVLAGLLLTYGLSPWIRQALIKALPEATQGLYSFEELHVRVRPLHASIQLTDVKITWDSLQYRTLAACDSAPANLFRAEIPDIEVTLLRPWHLWTGQPLTINKIRFKAPLITLVHLKSPGANPGFIKLARAWMTSLANRFGSVSIDDIDIESGELRFNNDRQFSQDAFVAKDLKIRLKELFFDQITVLREKKPFRIGTFTVDVGVEDYSYILADSTYEIRAARLGFSSDQDEVSAEAVQLRPNYRKRKPSLADSTQTGNLYELRIEKVLLGGFNLQEWLTTGFLNLGSIRLAQPELIQVTSGYHPPDTLNPARLLAQLTPLAKGLSIRGISVDRGSYRRIPGVGDTTGSIRIEGLGAYLQNFRLDSQSVTQNRLIFSDETELRADGFELILNQGKYRLTGETTYLSTPEKRAFVNKVALHPLGKLPQNESTSDFLLERIEVDGLDFLQALTSRSLNLKRLQLTQPAIAWVAPLIKNKEKADSVALKGLSATLLPWYDRVDIADFKVVSGKVSYRQPANGNFLLANSLSVQIHDLAFVAKPSQASERPFQAASLSVSAKVDSARFTTEDGSLNFSFRGISWNTEDSLLTIRELGMVQREKAGSKNEVLRVHAPHITLSGWDAYDALFLRKLVMEKLTADSARISLYGTGNSPATLEPSWQYPDLKPWLGNYFDTVRVNLAEARNVRLMLPGGANSPSATAPLLLRLKRFNWNQNSGYEPGKWWYADEAFVAAGAGKIGPWEVESVFFSTLTRNLDACQVQFRDSVAEWTLPNVSLKKLDWEKYLKHKHLHVRSMLIDQPELYLTSPPSNEQRPERSALWSKISPLLNQLSFDSLKIAEARTDLVMRESSTLQVRNFNALFQDFRIDSALFARDGFPFTFGGYDLELDINGYTWNMPDSVYQLSVGKIGFSSRDSLFYTSQLQLKPRPSANLDGVQATWDILAPKLVVKGLNLAEVINQKKIVLRSLVLEGPEITWKVMNEDDQPFEEAITASFQQLLNRFSKISIGEVRMEHASMWRERLDRPNSLPTLLPDFSITLIGFAPDRQEALRPGRYLYASDVIINVHRFVHSIKQGEYLATIFGLEFRAKAGTILTDSVVIGPVMGTYEFIRSHGYAVDWVHAKFIDIRLQGLQSLNFLARGALKADLFTIADLDVSIFRDRNYPPRPERHPPMPQELLRRAIVPIEVDSFQLENGHFVYEEILEGWEKPGRLSLDSLRMSFRHVSNIPGSASIARMHTTALLMGSTELDLQVEFPLNDTLDTYRLNGFVGPMPISTLNPILSTAAYIQINEGYSQKMEFTLLGNKHLVTGRMRFYYDDLKLSMFDRKGKSHDIPARKGLLSALANSLMVRSKNPNKKFLRVGRIRYTTEPFRFITGHWVKAISEGAMSSIGIKGKEERNKIFNTRHRK